MAFIKAKKTAWNTGRGMALLYEDDPKNGVIIPIDALPPLGAHARRVIAGVQASKGRETKTYDWRYAHPLKDDAFAVETMRADSGGAVILVIDPKTAFAVWSISASTRAMPSPSSVTGSCSPPWSGRALMSSKISTMSSRVTRRAFATKR